MKSDQFGHQGMYKWAGRANKNVQAGPISTSRQAFIIFWKFLSEKFVPKVRMHAGVMCNNYRQKKDKFVVEGNDIEAVFQSAALIYQSTQESPNSKIQELREFKSQIIDYFATFSIIY